VYHRDSRNLLRDLASRPGDPVVFFYLDAHWGEDVPRFEELQIIHQRWTKAIVMIDDFCVRDDSGYQFTHYAGVPLDLEYLPELPGWRYFYPAARSAEETGYRRGCLILTTPALADAAASLNGLRPVNPDARTTAAPAAASGR
jgi:hypothetical protein